MSTCGQVGVIGQTRRKWGGGPCRRLVDPPIVRRASGSAGASVPFFGEGRGEVATVAVDPNRPHEARLAITRDEGDRYSVALITYGRANVGRTPDTGTT